jgi:flagellar protein FlaF
MNPYAAAAQVASTPQEGNPRATEAWALTEAGRRLAQAAARGDNKAMREALRLNWRLWTIFQADLTVAFEKDPTNEITINMLTLCQFVDRHTVDSLAEPTSEKLDALINLNRQIAAGLKESLEREPGEVNMAQPAPSHQQAPVMDSPKPQTQSPGSFSAFA